MLTEKKWERKVSSETRKSTKELKTIKGYVVCYIEDTNSASVVILSDACSRNWSPRSNAILLMPKNTADYGK